MPKFGMESLKISKEQRKTHVKKPKGTVFRIGLSMKLFHDQSINPYPDFFVQKMLSAYYIYYTENPVLSHSKIDKTKILMQMVA